MRMTASRLPFEPCGPLAHQRDQLAAEGDRVVVRVEAADQERRDAEPDVVEQRLGHRLGTADERRRAARRARGRGASASTGSGRAARRARPGPAAAASRRWPACRSACSARRGWRRRRPARAPPRAGGARAPRPPRRSRRGWGGRRRRCAAASSRPAARAASCTRAICSAVSSSGSPHSANTSACLPPTRNAASEEPPKYRGRRGCCGERTGVSASRTRVVAAVVVERLLRRPRPSFSTSRYSSVRA